MRLLIYIEFLGFFVGLLKGEINTDPAKKVHNGKYKKVPWIGPSPVGPLLLIGMNLIYLNHLNMVRRSPEIISSGTFEEEPSISQEEWNKIEDIIVDKNVRHPTYNIDDSISPEMKLVFYLFDMSSPLSKEVDEPGMVFLPSRKYLRTEGYRYTYHSESFYKYQERISNFFGFPEFKRVHRILVFYMIKAKALTDVYSCIQLQNLIHYQKFETAGAKKYAERLLEASLANTQKYLYYMKILMTRTKSTFESLSAESQIDDSYVRANSFFRISLNLIDDKQISLESVDAPPGYVVTGMRWKKIAKVHYIQLEVGKFLDGMRVDEKTVKWLDIKSHPLKSIPAYLITHIQQGPGQLGPERYVTGLQMSFNDGHLRFLVKSSRTYHPGTYLSNDTVQHDNFTSPLDAYVTRSYAILLDSQDFTTAPSHPIGGFGINFRDNFRDGTLILGLGLYPPDYSNMIDVEQFDKYANLFELKSSSHKNKGNCINSLADLILSREWNPTSDLFSFH